MKKTKSPLIAAAISGLILGVTSGCSADETKTDPADKSKTTDPADKSNTTDPVSQEKHACKGYNTCKNKGKSGNNECSKKGDCATVDHHGCKGKNTCKNLGGCGSGDNGCKAKNSCKGKGGCAIPIKH